MMKPVMKSRTSARAMAAPAAVIRASSVTRRKGETMTAPLTRGAMEFTRAMMAALALDAFPRLVSSTGRSIARPISSMRRVCSSVSAS